MESITNLNLLNAIWIIWKELSKKRRIQVILLFILMLICGAFELISLASVIPFLVVLTEPSRLTEINQFNFLLDILKLNLNRNSYFHYDNFWFSFLIYNDYQVVKSLFKWINVCKYW